MIFANKKRTGFARVACTLALAVSMAGASFVVSAPAQAQSLNELLQQAKSERARAAARDRERLNAMRGDRNQQRALVEDMSAKVAAAQARSVSLNTSFEDNEKALTEAQESLDIQLGDLKELFGVVRQEASEVRSVVANSLITGQLGDRTELLDRLDAAEKLPSIDDLDALRLLIQEEMTEQSNVVRFNTRIFDSAGVPYDGEAVRVGAFNLISGDKFLSYDPASKSIKELGRQPKSRFRSNAAALFNSNSGTVKMTVDPSQGQLLQALVRSPNQLERVAQGGPVGYIILGLGAIGLLLALWRGLALSSSGAKISSQLRNSTPKTNNALGRILQTYTDSRDADTETLELKMDEAILKETPKLEQWQGAIKIIAAVAPLLGLLGTVIGMIDTFQAITLYGTGDPRLMADGISKALVTTMLGLIVAIPMVLLHSMIASMSKSQIEILEEQSAGIIARQSEGE
ncbi:MAG: MotA/TolQ/ExbB proton channel family protein [Gammaproteobacteria bacterium]